MRDAELHDTVEGEIGVLNNSGFSERRDVILEGRMREPLFLTKKAVCFSLKLLALFGMWPFVHSRGKSFSSDLKKVRPERVSIISRSCCRYLKIFV